MRARRLAIVLCVLATPGVARPQTVAPAPAAANRPPAPAAPAAALPNKWTGADYVIGSEKAKVTLVEYASIACPHCARFDADVFPAFKARYVDTGKVRFVYREMLVGSDGMVQVAAIGFLLARCAGYDRYFSVVEAVYRAQPQIFGGGDVKAIFARIAKDNGLSEAQLDACVADKAALKALDARVQHAVDVDKIDSTPTLVANGQMLKQTPGREWDFPTLDAQLRPLLTTAPSGRRTARARA